MISQIHYLKDFLKLFFYYRNMKKGYECAEEFKEKCMTPMQKESMGFLTEGSTHVYNEFCTEGSKIRTGNNIRIV